MNFDECCFSNSHACSRRSSFVVNYRNQSSIRDFEYRIVERSWFLMEHTFLSFFIKSTCFRENHEFSRIRNFHLHNALVTIINWIFLVLRFSCSFIEGFLLRNTIFKSLSNILNKFESFQT